MGRFSFAATVVAVVLVLALLPQIIRSPALLVAALAAIIAAAFGPELARRWRRRRAATATPALSVSLRPPPQHHARPGPTTLEGLARELRQAGLGTVWVRPAAVELNAPDGGAVQLRVRRPDSVSMADVEVLTNSFVLAVHCLDAVARLLGPMMVTVEGAELLVDGIAPRAQLEEELGRRLQDRARELERRLDPPPPRGKRLH